ncbi:hypothetical protein DUNSADRAFT_12947 [Dunaliella salina]|uniref:Uncharacterized protein n=1 Tax=Dunaliella salina TaxID=3046 RepID=A0ABQ7GAE8_DUNSA|nr:hypothetical protein DUNSADRAFT_12947 [Dunaliella salina]|eukprot:KAF5831567.1 hypothetical protein DUNSADRAFT_12947 [Dunaliella salina]
MQCAEVQGHVNYQDDIVSGQQHECDTTGRMALLEDSFNKCLQLGLTQPSFQDMQGYFPSCPEAVIHALLELYKQVLAHIHVHSQAEFKDICSEQGIQSRLAEVERLSANAKAQQQPGHMEYQGAVDASERHARVTAKQHEVAYLQHLLDQATSTRDHLLEAAAQKHVEAHKQVQAYAGLGMDVKEVFEASKSWEAL